ncbi:MAG: hypothetical protein HZA50_13995 [Planctomycetes bacterium]|nr:hypothetical protein [Planctomycetota bacterium]
MIGQTLLILEFLVATLLLTAILTACSARTTSFFIELVIWPAFLIFAVLPWAAAIFGIIWFYCTYPIYGFLLTAFCSAGAIFLIATVWIMRRGFKRPDASSKERRGARWNLLRLAIFWIAACICLFFTFILLDVIQQDKTDSLKAEACRIAEELSPKSVPDEKNAALLCQKAISLLDEQDKKNHVTKDKYKWSSRVTDWQQQLSDGAKPDNKDMLAFLENNAHIIDLIRKAGAFGQSNWGITYNPPRIDLPLPMFGILRSLNRILCLSAWVNAYNNRPKEAITDLNAALSISNSILSEPPLIALLVSRACKTVILDAIKVLLSQNLLKSDDFCGLEVDPQLNYWKYFRRGIRMEFAFPLYGMGSGLGEYVSSDNRRSGVSSIYRVFLFGEDYACYQRLLQDGIRPDKMDNYLSYLPIAKSIQNTQGDSRGLFSSLMLSFGEQTTEMLAESDAGHGVLLLLKAACQYKRKYGDFSETLGKLLTEFLPTLPTDPFTGQDFKYVRTEGGQIIIYSLGPDQTDDRGAALDDKTRKGDISLTIR